MTDLFNIPESKSPRLVWMEKHDLLPVAGEWCWYVWSRADEQEERENCDYMLPCSFWIPRDGKPHQVGKGKTEDEAITDWARKNNVKLWNEEGV